MGLDYWSYRKWEADQREPADRFYPAIIGFLGYEPWKRATDLSAALIAERRRRGLSAERASGLAGVDPGTWLRWEKRELKPTGPSRAAIDHFLGFSARLIDRG
jgi:hypothetical protein